MIENDFNQSTFNTATRKQKQLMRKKLNFALLKVSASTNESRVNLFCQPISFRSNVFCLSAEQAQSD
jgi:hypothetical protein